MMLRTFFACATFAVTLPLIPPSPEAARPGSQTAGGGAPGCGDTWNDRLSSYCEVREQSVPGVNPIDVNAGANGGIRARGVDRSDVLVRARVMGYAATTADARRVVSGVRIVTTGGAVRAEGPDNSGDEHWSVSFDLEVPRTAQLALHTGNGGISIDDFGGTAEFRAHNGGVSLTNVSGDIHGETTNGGVTVNLRGDAWYGAGLDVRTQNGGIRLTIPEHYSAELETGTTNGRVSVDFPVTVQGSIGRLLTVTLGAGGARIRAITTNGGVSIHRQ
jgi:hypothetical protein